MKPVADAMQDLCLPPRLFCLKIFIIRFLNDSKTTYQRRTGTLRPIIEKESIAYAVASVNNDEIDRINILQASFKAMHLALNKLKSNSGNFIDRWKPF